MTQLIHRTLHRWLSGTVFLVALWTGLMVRAEDTTIAVIDHPNLVDFQEELLPILRKKCLACHNATDAESDLVLETPDTILEGGLDGPAITPGMPDESLMLALASRRKEPVMPPEDNEAGAEFMTPEELALFKLWIEQGAKGKVIGAKPPIQWNPLGRHVNPVFAAAQSLDGRFIVAGRGNQIWIYDVRLDSYAQRLVDPRLSESTATGAGPIAHLDLVQSVALSHDGKLIASGGYRTVKLWQRDSDTGEPRRLRTSNVKAAAITSDATIVVESSDRIMIADSNSRSDSDIPMKEMVGETGEIVSIALSSRGDRVAAFTEDNTLKIWNENRELTDSKSESPRVVQLAWVDSSNLAGGGTDTNVYIWTMDAMGKLGEPRLLMGHKTPVGAVSHVNESRLISASEDGDVRLWDVASGKTLSQFDHGAAVRQIAASAPTHRMVTVGADSTAKLWDLDTGELVAELKDNPQLRWELEQLRLDDQVAKRHVENAKSDLEAANKRITDEKEGRDKAIVARDKANVELDKAVQADDEAAKTRLSAEQKLTTLKETLSADEQRVADAEDEGAKKSAKKQLDQRKQMVAAAEKSLTAAMKAADKSASARHDKQRAFESAERSVSTSERVLADAKRAAEESRPKQEAAAQREQVAAASVRAAETDFNSHRHVARISAFNSKRKLLATCDGEGRVIFWNSRTGLALQLVTLPAQEIRAIAFDRDDRLTALLSDGQLIPINARTHWRLARTLGSPDDDSPLEDRVMALSFSPDDSLLAIGGGQPSRSGQLSLYRVCDATPVREFKDAHSDTVLDLAFSPDGRQLASSGADRFMKVWDVTTGRRIRTFEGHSHHVTSVSWRADGRVLATGGADNGVKLWNAKDGSQIKTVTGFGKAVTSIQFAGATDVFFAACGDQHLYRCDIDGKRDSIGQGQDFLHVVTTDLQGKTIAFGGHDSIVRLVNDKGDSLAELTPTIGDDS